VYSRRANRYTHNYKFVLAENAMIKLGCIRLYWFQFDAFPSCFGYGCMLYCSPLLNKWSKDFDKSPHRMSCHYWRLNDPCRCMPLLTVEWSLCCVHRSKYSQCFSVVRTNPKIASCFRGIWMFLGPASKSTLQSASRSVQLFCWAHTRDQQTDRQTDKTDHATPSVAIGHI